MATQPSAEDWDKTAFKVPWSLSWIPLYCTRAIDIDNKLRTVAADSKTKLRLTTEISSTFATNKSHPFKHGNAIRVQMTTQDVLRSFGHGYKDAHNSNPSSTACPVTIPHSPALLTTRSPAGSYLLREVPRDVRCGQRRDPPAAAGSKERAK